MSEGRILLVDDDPDLLRVYSRALRSADLEVVPASDGDRGVEAARESRIDLIVTDINMPRMTGIELLRAVRKTDLDVPVILMTGNPLVESAAEAVELGALRYLMKPVDVKELREVALKAVRLGHLARAKRQALTYLGMGSKQMGDLAGLDASFNRCLESLWMAYQPIVSWKAHEVFAYEALLRSREPTLPTPGDILDAAERLKRMDELGRVIRATVARDLESMPADVPLFVNLHTLDLLDEDLVGGKSPLTAFASRVVLEVTERATLEGIHDVRERIAALRRLGYGIALDDLGAGYAGLTSFAHLEPDVVKVDMSLVRDIEGDRTKQKLVGSLARLCGELGMKVVCEGVETCAERDAIVELDCDLLQGYLFARPGPSLPSVVW